MRDLVFYLCVFLTGGNLEVNSSKILLLPFGMYSHININTRLGRALLEDGHEVWVLTQDSFRGDVESRGLIPLTYPLQLEDDLFLIIDRLMEESPDGVGVNAQLMADESILMSSSRVCDSVMQNEDIMTAISDEKFDLVIFDGVVQNLCFLMIPYVLDVPFVTLYGFQTTSWVAGVTGMPSIEPEIEGELSNRMDFWERLENLKSWLDRYDNRFYHLFSDHHMDSYCPAHKPKIPLRELARQAEIFLINYEIMCLDYPRVSAPNMQYIGGSTATPAKPLPPDLQTFIAGSDHGFVLMSLGSMKALHRVWKIMGNKLFQAFGALPQKVIVQYRLDEVHGEVPANVKLMKWIPQNDILGHRDIKLFVTHGGNNGQNEAAYHGVPMLIIPIMDDQGYNSRRVESRGYGKYVKNKRSVTSEELYHMMTEIINNKTYSDNIKKCSAIICSMPSAQEKFVFWVNHILQFGGAHLRPPSLDMPLYEVLMLDILAYYVMMCLVALHAAIVVLFFACKHLAIYLRCKKK